MGAVAGRRRCDGHLPQAAPAIPTGTQMRTQFTVWDAAAIVAVTADHSALGRYLTGLLGPPAFSAGGILGWRLPSAE